jgi:hypothetical protein
MPGSELCFPAQLARPDLFDGFPGPQMPGTGSTHTPTECTRAEESALPRTLPNRGVEAVGEVVAFSHV